MLGFAQGTGTSIAPVNSPLDAQASLGYFRLQPGLRLELAAAEPEVIDPVAVQFDESGRMWVVEMRDYPHGPAEGQEPRSAIKVLEDRDHDGRFETATVFADKLLFATGVQPWRGGVIVTLAGEVAYLKDTDGDGRADLRETWFRGFAQENSQLRANHPRFALDNHVYVANGLRGGTVVDPRRSDSVPVALDGKDFRFHPTTFAYEALTGVGQFGLTFDDFGNRFVCSNRNPLKHVVLEERYLRRNPAYAPATAVWDVAKAADESRVFPLSRAWTTSNLHAGQFTAACGCLLFRGNALPKSFYGNAFTCDPTGNLVHREIVSPGGVTFTAWPAEEGVEFLASSDEWFRPVNLTTGPDGALYVVDMYRAVIEHPQFMPDELKQRPDLLLGADRGRIYRVTATEQPEYRWPRLAELSSDTLAGLLEHPNAWQRETAARLLFERQDKSVANRLMNLVTNGRHPAARVHALWALQGLNALPEATIQVALRDEDPNVRAQAVAVAETRLAPGSVLRHQVVELAVDEAAQARFHVALALAPIQDETEVAALRDLLLVEPGDVWVRRAAAIASGNHSVALLETLLHDPPWQGGAADKTEMEVVREFVALAALSQEDDARRRVLRAIVDISPQEAGSELQRLALQAFADALARGRSPLAIVLEKLEDKDRQAVEQILAAATALVVDAQRPTEARIEAVRLLAHSPEAWATLEQLALVEPQTAVRIQAIAALPRDGNPEPWRKLLSEFASQPPALRRAVVNATLGSVSRTALLLDAIAAGQIQPAELDRAQVDRLLQHRDQELRERSAKLLAAAVPEDRQKVLADYQAVLQLPSNPQAGRAVFAKQCATCHRIGDVGVNVAPDISDSRTKEPAQLLADILQPNRAIDNNYVSYSVVTIDGQVLTGVIDSDTASSITLRQPEGKTVTLLRSEIDELRSNGVSLMPEGLEKNIPPQEMAHLISFIKNWRYLDGRTPLGGAKSQGAPSQ